MMSLSLTWCTKIVIGPSELCDKRKGYTWSKSESLDSEFRKESLRKPGFEDLVKRILEEASAPQEEAAVDVLPGLDPRFQMIRDFIAEQA